MPHEITREKFIEATGREPQHDDLERCNCPEAGSFGHLCCGWNAWRNKPQFEIGPQAWNGKGEERMIPRRIDSPPAVQEDK